MKEVSIKGFEGKELACYIWDDCVAPKGVIQIIHGMQEHAKRYDGFAQYMNRMDYIVFASDLRAHGKTAGSVEKLGHTNTDLFAEVVQDQIMIAKRLKKDYKKPIIVLGHSFGSFITQRLIQLSDIPSKVILSGTAYTKTCQIKLGKFFANHICNKQGADAPAKIIEDMSFRKYGKKFLNGNWLSRDEKKCKAYREDEYCGTPFPAGFYRSMFNNLLKNYEQIDQIRPNLPIFIISGDEDAVSKNGKLAEKLCLVYRKAHKQAEMKIYHGARHELINETNKEEVYNDILDFIEK